MQTRTQVLMGTFVNITLPQEYNTQISQSFATIKTIEDALSSYDENAKVYQLNQTHSVTSNSFLKEALEKSIDYYHNTQGYFDITIGSISKDLYHFGEENETLPSKEARQKAVRNIDGIMINEQNITTQANIVLDLGGVGKGYAVDKVSTLLQEQNITQGIIALSGDIRCLHACVFELQSPYSQQTFARLNALTPNLSISTSGTYRRYVKTQEHHHLINPKTASQGKAFVSVSLFTHASNATIDAYATAISVMPKDIAFDFLKKHHEIGFVLVESDGTIRYGNVSGLVSIKWLDYNERATTANNIKKSATNTPMAKSLIHPDTTTPKEMKP
ncbi:MAG: FAD:protein FMN transferase [Campylobacterota bacterium]|nr:FAD:protein FMN transferase [Campylobacterota bacterium]